MVEVFIFPLTTVFTFKVRKKAKIRNRHKLVLHLTQVTIWKSDKNTIKRHIQESQEASSSQQVTTRLHDTDKTMWQRQTQNKKDDPQKSIWNDQ